MELQVVDGEALELAEAIFTKKFNETLVHQAVVTYMAGGRAGSKAQKNRSAVSGGGIKPWRQKGTGRARAGTIRSPLWRSGGVTFAASPRNYSKKINRKMYRSAMQSILAQLVRDERLVVIDALDISAPKTKDLIAKLNGLVDTTNVLLITAKVDNNVVLSSRNLHKCEVLTVSTLNPVSLIAHDKVVATREAMEKIQEWLS
ncbi:MAG TPA: 50S ribosomal protein L4 [Thiothrix sp.]|nr:50S ribosomal protein L4 [Thiothrix sp.]